MFIKSQLWARYCAGHGNSKRHTKDGAYTPGEQKTWLKNWDLSYRQGGFYFLILFQYCTNYQKSCKYSCEGYRMTILSFTVLSFEAKFYNNLTFI